MSIIDGFIKMCNFKDKGTNSTAKLCKQCNNHSQSSKRISSCVPFHGVTMSSRPIEDAIRQKITAKFDPIYLEVVNESHRHNVPENAETHFKVMIVSREFEGITLLKRHRIVNEALSQELKGGVHALSIITQTPDQWEENRPMDPSPKCQGGFGK